MSPRYALFAEPAGSALEWVKAGKAALARTHPDAPYLAHPPHATVLFGPFEPPERWLAPLADAMAGVAPLPARVDGPLLFADDAATGGGQTLAFRVVPEGWHALQAAAAGVLAGRLAQPVEMPAPGLPESWRESLRLFGWPFVGPHWVPHLTLASLRVTRDAPEVQTFLATSVQASWLVDALTIWEVDGEHHRRLARIPLGGQPCHGK